MRSIGALLLLVSAGCAAPTGVVVHAASRHLDDTRQVCSSSDLDAEKCVPAGELNETNPGLGLEWDLSAKWRGEVGAFVNSYEDVSPYGSLSWTALRTSRLELGLTAGIAYYPSGESGELVPLGGPTASVRIGPLWPRLVVVPWTEDVGPILLLSVRIPFGSPKENQ